MFDVILLAVAAFIFVLAAWPLIARFSRRLRQVMNEIQEEEQSDVSKD